MIARSAGCSSVEYARAAFEARAFLAGDLRHGALGREVAVQDGEVAVGFDRIASSGRTIVCPAGYGRTAARFSATVRPVTVRQPPCSMPASSSVFCSG